MTERFTDDVPEWQRREQAVARALNAVGKGLKVGSITVAYDSPASDTGQVWIKADCSSCGAERVMRASNEMHVRHLAIDLIRYGCTENGHDQTGQIEVINHVPMALGSMSLQELVEVEEEAQERLSTAQDDLMIVRDIREARFTSREES